MKSKDLLTNSCIVNRSLDCARDDKIAVILSVSEESRENSVTMIASFYVPSITGRDPSALRPQDDRVKGRDDY